FDLDEHQTKVTSQLHLYRNPSSHASSSPLVLNGENMRLLSVKMDGRALAPEEYSLDSHTLKIDGVPQEFQLEIENEIDPKSNTALDGLYKSGTIFCTQNEPEGFRKITYSLDRSDVMSKYTTKIIANQKLYPILLSNGNEIGRGTL